MITCINTINSFRNVQGMIVTLKIGLGRAKFILQNGKAPNYRIKK